jgi:DNA invertase Pin-like site-specific DNA recombinase
VTAVAYLRVSTDDQTLGPEAQRSAIEAWAAREGVQVAAWHVDAGVSGAAPIDRRPALLAALDDLGSGSMLVVAKRDRLARDVVIAATIERAAERVGATVVSADGVGVGDGPEAELLRRIVDAVAAYERGLIRGRTKAALAAKRAKGERTGSVPYGKQLSGDGIRLVDSLDEQAVIHRIDNLAARGMSHRAIAKRLNTDGVPARGSRWHATTVGRLLRRSCALRQQEAADRRTAPCTASVPMR